MKHKIWKIFLIIFILAFFLNLLWEVSHSLLYDWNTLPLENIVSYCVPKILKSTLGDGFYITLIFIINSLFRKNLKWINKPKKIDYVILIILGVIFAIFIEIKAKIFNLWAYNQYMPTIFGIGLTPLIQLAIVSILVLLIISKVTSSHP